MRQESQWRVKIKKERTWIKRNANKKSNGFKKPSKSYKSIARCLRIFGYYAINSISYRNMAAKFTLLLRFITTVTLLINTKEYLLIRCKQKIKKSHQT